MYCLLSYATWSWGSNLVVHELVQRADGALGVCVPDTVRNYFAVQQLVYFNQAFKTPLPTDGTVVFTDPTKGFEVMLRTSEDFENGYYVRVQPQHQRLVFDAWLRRGD